jgi:hypothetical protein
MFCHSHGQELCCRACELLGEINIPVRKAIFADAWDGFDGELLLPTNFVEVEAWTQSEGRPRGSKIILPPGSPTLLTRHKVSGTRHFQMDEREDVRAAVVNAVKGRT